MSFEFAMVVLLAAVVFSRILMGRALDHLSAEQKASLFDAFRGQRMYGLIPLVALLALYFGLLSYTSVSRSLVSGVYWAALVVYLAWSFWFTKRRMAALLLPQAYLTQFAIARAVQYVGIGVLLAAVIGDGI